MYQQGGPFVAPDTSKFTEWIRLHGLTKLQSYAGAPIRWNGTIVGILNLESAEPNFYTQQHADLLEAFADHAAIAIRNAQLYGQAQELAALKERQRLTRDLHDAVSQTLWSASILADVLPAQWEQDIETGRRQLKRLSQLTRGALAEMRTLLLEQLPTALTEVSLGELMQFLADSAASRGALQASVSIEGDCQPTAEVQMAFYRIAQEALNNVIRHAEATQITIMGRCSAQSIELTITDNGHGFDPASNRPGHLGLSIMQERAEAVGAQVHVSGQPGHGTQVTITWTDENDD
jgi:two-component system nitrate/nitrite sensor histidine kinase NarX